MTSQSTTNNSGNIAEAEVAAAAAAARERVNVNKHVYDVTDINNYLIQCMKKWCKHL